MATFTGLEQQARTGRGILEDVMTRYEGGQPGARQMAAEYAARQQRQQMASQLAGMTGPQAAQAQRRQTAMAPVLQAAAAEQQGIARAGDEEARIAQIMQAFGLSQSAAQQLYAAEQAERQRKSQERAALIGGLTNIGTAVATGGAF